MSASKKDNNESQIALAQYLPVACHFSTIFDSKACRLRGTN
jgi:hypothetical protein